MLVWFKPTFKLERWKLMSKMCLHVTIMKDNLNSVRQMGRKIIVKFNNCTNNHYHVFMGKFRSCIYTKYALNNQRTQNTIMQNSRSTKYKISKIKNKKERKILKLLSFLLLSLFFYQTIIFIIKNLHVDKLINNNRN